jgi:hypothetical protein
LTAASTTASGAFLVCVAQALHALTRDPSWANPIASVLATAPHWGDRIDAAIALAGFVPTPHLVQALAAAVRDPEYLVRYHSANTLLRYAGKTGDIADHAELFAKITPSADRSAWRNAADQLSAALS